VTLVAFASGRSPGLTTAVHAMALTWAAPRRGLIVELDPDGGSLAARAAISSDPGLVSLAAAGRRGFTADDVLGHCRQLPDGTAVLAGPTSPDRSASALATIGGRLASALDVVSGFDALADCGRIDSRSPALEVVSSAPFLVLVVEPTVEGVAHLATRLPDLGVPDRRVALVPVGDRPYRPDEIAHELGLPILGVMARDPRGAAQLAEGRPNWRSPLLRSAAAISFTLCSLLPPAPHPEVQRNDPPPRQTGARPLAVPDAHPLGGRLEDRR
jgi:hypothetical protein